MPHADGSPAEGSPFPGGQGGRWAAHVPVHISGLVTHTEKERGGQEKGLLVTVPQFRTGCFISGAARSPAWSHCPTVLEKGTGDPWVAPSEVSTCLLMAGSRASLGSLAPLAPRCMQGPAPALAQRLFNAHSQHKCMRLTGASLGCAVPALQLRYCDPPSAVAGIATSPLLKAGPGPKKPEVQ